MTTTNNNFFDLVKAMAACPHPVKFRVYYDPDLDDSQITLDLLLHESWRHDVAEFQCVANITQEALAHDRTDVLDRLIVQFKEALEATQEEFKEKQS